MHDPPLCSVVIPAYNEQGTIAEVIRRVAALPFPKEVIVVDDGSTDGTAAAAREAARTLDSVRVVACPQNRGKGSAVRTGFAQARGDLLIIQDADLELWPEDLPRLVDRFADPNVLAVYGSRFAHPGYRCSLLHRVANSVLSRMTRLLYRAQVSDMETCYKLFRREVIDRIVLESERFDFEPEITAKVLRLGVTIEEEPIRYKARTVGKKIGWRDGVEAVVALVRWRLVPMHRVVASPDDPLRR